MSKDGMPVPCNFFDLRTDRPTVDCPQDTSKGEDEGCFYWMENYSENDVFEVCRNRGEIDADTKTLDMFPDVP